MPNDARSICETLCDVTPAAISCTYSASSFTNV